MLCFIIILLLVLRAMQFTACTPTLTHPHFTCIHLWFFSDACEITTSLYLVSYDWFCLPAKHVTLFVTLTWSYWAFMIIKQGLALMRCLLVYKVWFHRCSTPSTASDCPLVEANFVACVCIVLYMRGRFFKCVILLEWGWLSELAPFRIYTLV